MLIEAAVDGVKADGSSPPLIRFLFSAEFRIFSSVFPAQAANLRLFAQLIVP